MPDSIPETFSSVDTHNEPIPFAIEYTIGEPAPVEKLRSQFPKLFSLLDAKFTLEFIEVNKKNTNEIAIILQLRPKTKKSVDIDYALNELLKIKILFWGHISDTTYHIDMPAPSKIHDTITGSHMTEDVDLQYLEGSDAKWNSKHITLTMNGCISIPNRWDQFNSIRYHENQWKQTNQYGLWDEIFTKNAEERALALLQAHLDNHKDVLD